jgi:hypothetical protein
MPICAAAFFARKRRDLGAVFTVHRSMCKTMHLGRTSRAAVLAKTRCHHRTQPGGSNSLPSVPHACPGSRVTAQGSFSWRQKKPSRCSPCRRTHLQSTHK